jgi:hypothetical protein
MRLERVVIWIVEALGFVVVLFEMVVALGRREARLAPSPCKFSKLGNFQAIFRRRDSTVTIFEVEQCFLHERFWRAQSGKV